MYFKFKQCIKTHMWSIEFTMYESNWFEHLFIHSLHHSILFFSICFFLSLSILFLFLGFCLLLLNNLKCSWYKESRVKSMQRQKFKWHIGCMRDMTNVVNLIKELVARLVVAFHAFYTAFQCIAHSVPRSSYISNFSLSLGLFSFTLC